jgi:hypothetical protein
LKLQKNHKPSNLFEDLLGGPYSEPDFVKVDEIEALPPETLFEAVEKIEDKNTASTPQNY